MNKNLSNDFVVVDAPAEVNPVEIQALAGEVVGSILDHRASATIAFIDDERMNELNRQFRNAEGTTDVLSFIMDEEMPDGRRYLGDIAVSLPRARRQAKEFKHSLHTEILQLVTHGLIHLCGFNHAEDEGEMDKLELEIRDNTAKYYC